MNIKELKPGHYKIRKNDEKDSFRLLRVVDNGKAQKMYFGASIKGYHPNKISNLNEFEVVSKFEGKPKIVNSKIILSFQDSTGSTFNIPLENVSEVSKVFTALPWLKKHFVKERGSF